MSPSKGKSLCALSVLQYQRFLLAETKVFKLILANTPLPELLHTMVLSIEELFPETKASIFTLDSSGRAVSYCTAPNMPPNYWKAVEDLIMGYSVRGQGSPSFLQEQIIVSDISLDPFWKRYQKLARRYGVQSFWSTPVLSENKSVLAVFALFYSSPHTPAEQDIEFVNRSTQLLRIAIELIQKNNALQRSEERFRGAFLNAAIGMVITNVDCQYLSVNETYCKMLEYSEQELLQMTFLDLTLPEDKEKTQKLVEALKKDCCQNTVFEKRYITKNNKIIWVRLSISVPRDALGKPINFIAVCEDITPYRAAQLEREESEQRFRQLTENIEEVFWLTTAEHDQILYVSPAYEHIWGRSCDELYKNPKQWLEAIIKEDRLRMLKVLQGQDTSGYNVEYRILRPDGTTRWIQDRSFLIFDAQGTIFRVAGVAQDITERKQSEQSLRESEERFRLLSKATNDAIWDCNLLTNSLWWNEGFETLTGYQRNEIAMNLQAWMNLIHPEDFNPFIQKVFKIIDEGNNFWSAEYRFRRKDGTYASVLDRGNIIRDEKGRAVRMIGGITDLTERLALEEQLRQSQRLESLGQLTGGVAHDFNNLLTIILGNSELLCEQLENDSRLYNLADMINGAALRGAQLTKHLLAFARRQPLEPKVIDVNTLVDNMTALLHHTLGDNITIIFHKASNLWRTLIDPAQLENALLNLFLNARDAMPSGGQLIIETKNIDLDQHYCDFHSDLVPGKYIEIDITDTGSGIAPEDLKRVFEPFFSTKEKEKGTGLGLSMVFGFIKQSGGQINIYSELEKGTTIRIYLPEVVGSEYFPSMEPAKKINLQGNEKILLVEDNEKVRLYASEQLKAAGYDVLSAPNGLIGLELLRTDHSIALLFTDVIMEGGLSGKELADLACKLRPELKVLYTSGYPEATIVHQGHLDPGVQLLSKPYRRVDLLSKIREILDA